MFFPLVFLALGPIAFENGVAASSSIIHSDHVVHEIRALEPFDWSISHQPRAHKRLPLRIGLSQRNVENLESMLMAVSHPDSPNYGKHWTPQQVMDTFAPSEESAQNVIAWLKDAGFSPEKIRISANKGWIQVDTTVAEAEDLLKTEYHVYTHPCHNYSVPAAIQEHVELIRPTVHFTHRPSLKSEAKFKRAGILGKPSPGTGPITSSIDTLPVPPGLIECAQMMTPGCLRALYNVPQFNPLAMDKNSYGIVEFTPQAFLADDLDLFFSTFSPNVVGARPQIVLVDGAVVQNTSQGSDFNGESDLDLEYAMALTYPQNVTLLQTGDLVEGAGFDNWLDAVDGSFCTFDGGDDPFQDGIYPDTLPGGFDGPESCGIVAPPLVVSVSYGEQEWQITSSSATRQCNEYGKLGLMGTTILYSSGDNGVAGLGGQCLDSSARPVSSGGTRFNPQFPASCPFVTSVGATQMNPNSTIVDPEAACETHIFSGGGFSDIFSMPDYQKSAVSSYLTNDPPPYTSSQFNTSGSRAYPDLSANGANYVAGVNGQLMLEFGTSAATPVVGSFITMINDARLAAGKGPVGFINPAIYSDAFKDGFNDITEGSNPGCMLSLYLIDTVGFIATDGWDPVTGVGTPNVSKLISLFLALP
ncbi:hypothetical protein GYMLUDRAFT_59078 [Collybiopsis luxurians FD-317 M1]|uniref:tripeptidyl-peptidase II n=1 Tax=Collybiopsis luxurians FD-317 M1 TaxID=944289 RepID=A0A0D0CQ44_9AGAR|nr:hypothetical protein GYMLUDRAFT_59078 [Collybiopsis luxurians FD-317 M1]